MPDLNKILPQVVRFSVQIIFYLFCAYVIYLMYRFPAPSVNSLLLPKRYNQLSSVFDSGENYYAVYINGTDMQQLSLIISDEHGQIWVSQNDLTAWNIALPSSAPKIFDDQKYYKLSLFPGAVYSINKSDMTIQFQFPVTAFIPRVIDAGSPQFVSVTPPSPGAYLNYDLLETHSAQSQPNNIVTGLFQLGVYNSYGVGTNSFLLQNTPDTEWALRLLTTWRYDKPDKMWTLSIGDDVSTSTNWSSSVNFGGAQWGTNFATQPAFITFPRPGYQGQATVQSSLDLFINNSLAKNVQLTPGSYSLTNIPYVDGAGNMRIVTTDIMGRQQVVNVPFYVSNQLLKTGLVDSSYEVGLIRQNLGLASFDYARFIAAATSSVGVNDTLTLQWHVEGLSDQQTIGGTILKQIGQIGVLDGSLAVSHINANNKDGGLALLAFQRQAQNYSIGLSSQVTTLYFTQQGLDSDQLSPRLINQVFGGVSFNGNGLSFNYIRQINRDQPGNNMVSATFTRNLFFDFSLSATGMTNLGGTKNKGVFLTVTRSLGDQTNVNLSNSVQNDAHQSGIQIQRNLPTGPGYGYSLAGATGTSVNSKLGSLSLQNDVGTYTGQILQFDGVSTETLNAEGAIILMGDHTYLSRNLNNTSFAVVQVPGFPDVDVSVYNQVAARTDRYGNALIPNLQPYQEATIAINTNQLPLNSIVNASSLTMTPYYNSGVVIPFPVKYIRNATLTVKQASGDYIPEGVSAGLSGEPPEFIVGTEGQTYFTGLNDVNTVNFIWDEHVCQITFKVPPPDPNNSVPDLGEFVCNEVTDAKARKAATDAFAAQPH
jgi:outer membrane usher protein